MLLGDEELQDVIQGLAAEPALSDDEEVCDTDVACIKAYEAAHMLYELEKFFTANSMHEDSSWAHDRLKKVKTMAENSKKQSNIIDFFGTRVDP